jgi:hypothetical protein
MSEKELENNIEEVSRILEQLKQEVRQRRQRLSDAGTPFGELPAVKNQQASLESVHSTVQVNPHLPIAWPAWPKGLWPKIVALVQKVVRRLLRWYMNPIVEQQNRYNAAVAEALDTLWGEVVQLQAEVRGRGSTRD